MKQLFPGKYPLWAKVYRVYKEFRSSCWHNGLILNFTPLQKHLHALHEAQLYKWAGWRSPEQAWLECPNPSWLLSWASHTSRNTHEQVLRAACRCVRLWQSKAFTPELEAIQLRAIEAAENWLASPSEETLGQAKAVYGDILKTPGVFDKQILQNVCRSLVPAGNLISMVVDPTCFDGFAGQCLDEVVRTPDSADLQAQMCEIIHNHLVCPYVKA